MQKLLKYQITYLSFLLSLVLTVGKGQSVSFSHLNTSNGLSENNVQSLAIDKNGFLWIGTLDGLNVYDGYMVTTYKKEDRPEMASNNVIHLTCDRHNRLWLGTSEGITWVDEKRNFRRVVLNDSVTRFASRTIMDTKAYGPVLFTSLGQYYFNMQRQKWERLDWIPEKLKYNLFHDAEPFDENKIIYATDSLVLIMDYESRRIVFEMPLTYVFSLCRYSENELAIGIHQGIVLIVDIHTNKVVREYKLSTELNRKMVNSTITEVRRAVNGDLLVGTGFTGLTIIDKAGNISRYMHDPIDPRSIAANATWRVLGGSNGDMIVGTSVAGVSIFNVFNKQAGYVHLFNDGQGDFYDNYVSKIAEDKKGNLWIGALERLIRWGKENNKTKFFYYYSPQPIEKGGQNIEIRSLCIDKQDRVWAGTLGYGVAILNESTGSFTKVPLDTSLGPAVKNNYILDLYTASDGYIWAGTGAGLYTIHPHTLKVNAFIDHPVLKRLSGKRVNAFLEDRQGNMWVATFDGIYYYDKINARLGHYTIENGLASNRCLTLFLDKAQNLYVGTLNGFSMISPNGRIRTYNRTNGLKYDYCAGILEDDQGGIWIANNKCMVRFDPQKETMQYFDENSGLSTEGFRVGSYLKTSKGQFLWGSRAGINYFFPGQLVNHPSVLKVHIYQADMSDSVMFLGGNESLSLNYDNNSVIFRFTAINLKGSRNIKYQYVLEGYEKLWQYGTDIHEARYTSLSPGNYNFKVKASIDGINWIDSGNTITLRIIPPVWQRWWFIAIGVIAVASIFYVYLYNRDKRIRKRSEELETEKAINYFASSMYEHHKIEHILWDVAKNCIGRLQFEDCVIYLMEPETNLLVQKAAHGPKSPKSFEIERPIAIPVGRGIVGSVALSGKPEIINDTSKDARYIVDDEQRFSEISVPIVSGGNVLGVIDCEHSKKGFFTQKHLSILTTIASLCANKIIRARAEEEKEKTRLRLQETQQKMTEVEMQALMAQMNPHFIFNCLNSINRYIVKSDQATASLYLTKFAKLIRLILDNSNTKNVILSNELEALKLYIDMEAIRFDKKFTYGIMVDDNVSADSIEVPPLIIQPYVENAIWHGLLHKQTGGHLCIHVSLPAEGMLQCVIEDDGVGRIKARELKSKSATTKKSLGMKLTESRLALLNKHAELNASIEIIDMYKENNQAAGTKVILKIPV